MPASRRHSKERVERLGRPHFEDQLREGARNYATTPLPAYFIRVPERALTLPARQLAVLTALLRYCRGKSFCWPSQRTLAGLLNCSLGCVNKALRDLAAAGVITKKHQRSGKLTCLYMISDAYRVPKKPAFPRVVHRREPNQSQTCKTSPLAGGNARAHESPRKRIPQEVTDLAAHANRGRSRDQQTPIQPRHRAWSASGKLVEGFRRAAERLD